MREVAVTALGIVSPLGTTVPEFSTRMFAGASGLSDIRNNMVAANFPVCAAGKISRTSLPTPTILPHLYSIEKPNFWHFSGLATEEALRRLPEGLNLDAIIYGTHNSMDFGLTRSTFPDFVPEDFDWDAFQPDASLNLIRQIAERGGHGPIDERNLFAISNACVSGNQAIGVAFQRIRSGAWDRVLVGAVYGMCTASELMNFHMLSTLATGDSPAAEMSRPFSQDRTGFVLGEGAASLVLEAREVAEARDAKILGLVSGYASTSDAYRITDGRPDGKAAAKAMQLAFAVAALTPDQIDAISAHGTSTRLNDKVETVAIKIALGSRAYEIPAVSLKSQTGHSIIAAGAQEAVASLLMLSEQTLAPTINYREFDPECDLDCVPNHARPAKLRKILSNSFGFGGQNACVVFEQAPAGNGNYSQLAFDENLAGA
jgi:3-oxoacyl-[acyl-carrier-protein] synthase II